MDFGRLKVSRHCVTRFRERIAELPRVCDLEVKRIVQEMIRAGIEIGGQCGSDRAIRTTSRQESKDIVFLLAQMSGGKGYIVKTALGSDHAVVNQQMRGSGWKAARRARWRATKRGWKTRGLQREIT